MRHGTCFRRRLSAHHAGAAPHSAVAELGVVRRCYALTENEQFMSLQFLHLGPAESAKGPQIRTAGLWNIAVAIERLTDELRSAREEAAKVPSVLAHQIGSQPCHFTLRSGQVITGSVHTLTARWILIDTTDGGRAFIATDSIESIVEASGGGSTPPTQMVLPRDVATKILEDLQGITEAVTRNDRNA